MADDQVLCRELDLGEGSSASDLVGRGAMMVGNVKVRKGCLIAELIRAAASLRTIGRELGCAPSTVSREVRRNRHASGAYRSAHAHRLATTRRARPRAHRLASDAVLREAVIKTMNRKWSSQQVSRALGHRFADTPGQLSHESVYQARSDRDRPLGDRCRASSARGGVERRPRRRSDARSAQSLRDMTPIHQHPAAVADRAAACHWELPQHCRHNFPLSGLGPASKLHERYSGWSV